MQVLYKQYLHKVTTIIHAKAMSDYKEAYTNSLVSKVIGYDQVLGGSKTKLHN